MAGELSGKVAIVTGGAAGIGRATVELFVAEGAKVVIADVNAQMGQDLAATLGEAAQFKKTDVSKREDMQALVDFTVAEFRGLHAMINNAGISDPAFGRFVEDDFAAFQKIMNVNLLGVMLGSQIAARHMAKNGGGSIVNMTSISGVRPGHGLWTYRASKAGVINLTQSIAVDLGVDLIRVNCIAPGNIPTEMGAYAHPAPGVSQEDHERMIKAIYDVRMTRQPLKRQGVTADIAQAALFLASDRSRHITGLVMPVDGGATAGDAMSLIQAILDARTGALSGKA